MREREVVTDPEVLGGTPVFRGTRVPVMTLFEYLEAGESVSDFLACFPEVRASQVSSVFEEIKDEIATAKRAA